MNILIAEDNPDMSKILTLYLKKEGYEVATVDDGEKAIAYLLEHKVDLAILDWMMPKKSGIDVCRDIQNFQLPVKVLMLTAKNSVEDEISGLSFGADEYIRKPFEPRVLLLRIKKLCGEGSVLRLGEISLNPDARTVTAKGHPIRMTKTEFELLWYFMRNPGRVLSREMILEAVWGIDYDGDIRTVDTHIRRLRNKIGEAYLVTHIGCGYSLENGHD